MIEIVFSVVGGLISGIISSLIFFYIMSRMRPKIRLGRYICKSVDDNGIFYGFKILNDSNYHVLEMKIEVSIHTPFHSNGGLNHSMKKINLKADAVMQFPRYRKEDPNATYALIVATRDDLESLWSSEAQFLEIKVHGKHSFSGINKSFQQKFYTKQSCIKNGLFNFGRSFDIS